MIAAVTLLTAALAGCSVSRVDDVAVKWPPFKQGTPVVLPSDPAQCPDLAGVYRAQGERRAGDADAFLLEDLRGFLTYPLDLPGMRDAPLPAWKPSPRATVSFVPDALGWQIEARDEHGARQVSQLVLQEEGADTAAVGEPRIPAMPSGGLPDARKAGCGSACAMTGASMSPWACGVTWPSCARTRADCC